MLGKGATLPSTSINGFISGGGPPGSVVLGVLAAGQLRPNYHGRSLKDDEVGTLQDGEDVDLQLGQSSAVVFASIAQDLVEQYTLAARALV